MRQGGKGPTNTKKGWVAFVKGLWKEFGPESECKLNVQAREAFSHGVS